MKKIQHFFESLNQKLEGDLSGTDVEKIHAKINTEAETQAKNSPSPLAPVSQAAAKGIDSIKSLISPVASKISAKVTDVLHKPVAAPTAAELQSVDPLFTPRPAATRKPNEAATTDTPVLIRSAAYQHAKESDGYLDEDFINDDIAQDTPDVDGADSDVKKSAATRLNTEPPVARPNLDHQFEAATAARIERDETSAARMASRLDHAASVSMTPTEPAMPMLSAEWVKTPSQPLPPLRKQKRELPVIDMGHIQRNLERSQRKLAIEGAKMPERKAAEPLPVIDPAEIRGRLQEIHGAKATAASPARSAPMAAPLANPRASVAETTGKPVVRTAPQPEVIRVFKSGGIAPQANQSNDVVAIPAAPIATDIQSAPVAAVAVASIAPAAQAPALSWPQIDGAITPPEWNAPTTESEFYPLSQASVERASVAEAAGIELPPVIASATPAPQPVVSTSVPTPTPVIRPSQFLRPDALSAASAPKPAWRGEDGLCLPLELLRPATVQTITVTAEDLLERSILIEEKLNEFKVKVSVLDAYAGPVITRFEVEPATGIRGAQVVNLAKDLARSLGLASVRVVETIPGKTCMGLELPNPTRQMIRLSEILSAPEYHGQVSPLTIALGKDISGIPVATDLAKTPHMLVAGTTGSGKSVGVNAMILSILFKATPEEVRFIMIDPKMLELSVYEGIPHLLAPVVTDMKLAANALNWCVGEMEKRYRLMSALGVRNLAGFNQKIADAEVAGKKLTNPFTLTPEDPEPLEHLPMIVVVVDEFADLMMVAGKKIEELIARLAQKARAAGIHLILATQRPSVDVITGLIKANIPTRLAFQVSSKIDSRTILDQMGAEALLGQGDMLFLPPGTGYPQRIHGAFVDDAEVHCVVEYLKQLGEPNYIEGVLYPAGDAEGGAGWAGGANDGEDADPLYDEAVAHVLRSRRASISAVQRQFRIGYNRAARLIEQMESAGIVSGMESNGNRTVLAPPGE